MNDKPIIQSPVFKLKFLDELDGEPDGLTAKELADRLGVAATTANQILAYLVRGGRVRTERFLSEKANRYIKVI